MNASFITLAPTSRRAWLEAAERADLAAMFGRPVGELGARFTAVVVTCGPRFYVRRIAERFASAYGYLVVAVRRSGAVHNPLTQESNTTYAIALERRQ